MTYRSVTVRLYAFLISVLYGASHPSHFTPGETAPGTDWAVKPVGSRTRLDTLNKRKNSCPCQESNHDSLTIQPIANHHTNRAIWTHITIIESIIKSFKLKFTRMHACVCMCISYNKALHYWREINTYDESRPCVSRNAAALWLKLV
jgi:hypothetical protein